jgi:hypothetical protein
MREGARAQKEGVGEKFFSKNFRACANEEERVRFFLVRGRGKKAPRIFFFHRRRCRRRRCRRRRCHRRPRKHEASLSHLALPWKATRVWPVGTGKALALPARSAAVYWGDIGGQTGVMRLRGCASLSRVAASVTAQSNNFDQRPSSRARPPTLSPRNSPNAKAMKRTRMAGKVRCGMAGWPPGERARKKKGREAMRKGKKGFASATLDETLSRQRRARQREEIGASGSLSCLTDVGVVFGAGRARGFASIPTFWW